MLDLSQPRAQIIEHLEAALRLADQTGDSLTSYLIERALDEARGKNLIAPKRNS
jgi:hypothetical protein